jgi:GT2 family glycosyltransferase
MTNHNTSINERTPPAVIGMNWISKLSVLTKANFFDECFIRCDDVDLSYRILHFGYIFAFQPHAVLYHRNESTYSGPFREGFLPGLYAAQTIKKHRHYLSAFRHRRTAVSPLDMGGKRIGRDSDFGNARRYLL